MAGSWWDDFSNNLATDLGPLLALFGETPTKQYLSECITTVDVIIFALAPMGVITAVVSAIRVRGTPSLRAFIGRAQEVAGTAEAELCSCTSRDVCELYSNGGIARIFGRPKILEIVYDPLAPPDSFYFPANGTAKAGIYTFEEYMATERGRSAWILEENFSIGTRQLKIEQEVCEGGKSQSATVKFAPNPNLLLNIGIKPLNKPVFLVAALVGVLIQSAVLVWAFLTRYHYKWLRGNGQDDYAFILTLIGTALLCLAMGFCAHLIESKTKEHVFERSSATEFSQPTRMFWVQPGNQRVGDQIFDSFVYCDKKAPLRRYITSWKDVGERSSDIARIWAAVFMAVVGFTCQFLGLRACHSSVAVAQLGATLAMSLIRAGLRTQRLESSDNLFRGDADFFNGHELDCLALMIEEPPNHPQRPGIKAYRGSSDEYYPKWMVSSAQPPEGQHDTRVNDCEPASTESIGEDGCSYTLTKLQTRSKMFPSLYGYIVKSPVSSISGNLSTSREEFAKRVERDINQWMSSVCCGEKQTRDGSTVRTLSLASKAVYRRARLARMTGLGEQRLELSSFWSDGFVTVRPIAEALAQVIEATMRMSFNLHDPWKNTSGLFWTLKGTLVSLHTPSSRRVQKWHDGNIVMPLRRTTNAVGVPEGSWKADTPTLEAVIGLWLWSLKEAPYDRRSEKESHRISRIHSTHPDSDSASDEMLEWELIYPKNGINIQKQKLQPRNLTEQNTSEEISCPALVQNGLWWRRDGQQPWCAGEPPPSDAQEKRRFFGWSNASMDEKSLQEPFFALEVTSRSSVTMNCAQEIYATFLSAILQIVDHSAMNSSDSGKQNAPVSENVAMDKLIAILAGSKLFDEEEARVCVAPILKGHNKWLFYDDLLKAAGSLANEYESQRKWHDAQTLWQWRMNRVFQATKLKRNDRDFEESTNTLRLSLLNACGKYYEAIFRKDKELVEFGYTGILELLKSYSQNETIATIPLIWADCGIVSNNAKFRSFSLAGVIRYYAKAALYQASNEQKSNPDIETAHEQLRLALREEIMYPGTETNAYQAIQDGDFSTALFLTSRNSLDEPWRTRAFIKAAQNGWFMVVRRLAKYGVAVNQEDDAKRTALSYASEFGDINTVTTLLNLRAKVKRSDGSPRRHKTPAHYAARQGHARIMRQIVQERSSSIDTDDESSMTPLSWAISSGNADTVRALLHGGAFVADPNHYHTKKPALHWAIRENRPGMIKVLLEFKEVNPAHRNGRTIVAPPLVCAAQLRRDTIFDTILNSPRLHDADATDKDGRAAIWWASALDLHSYVRKLLDSGKVHRPDAVDNEGQTPLSIAVEAGHVQVVCELLHNRSIDSELQIPLRSILIAALNGFIPVVDIMLPRKVKNKGQAKELLESYHLESVWHAIEHSEFWGKGSDDQIDEVGLEMRDKFQRPTQKELDLARNIKSQDFIIIKGSYYVNYSNYIDSSDSIYSFN